MALALREWDMVPSGVFVLLLQLVAINLSGAAVFALFGVQPKGLRYERGQQGLRWLSLSLTVVALGALLTWQFWRPVNLRRSTTAQRIAATVKRSLEQSNLVQPIDVQARFTRAPSLDQNACLILAYLRRRREVRLDDSALEQLLLQRLAANLAAQERNVTPLISLNFLDALSQEPPSPAQLPLGP